MILCEGLRLRLGPLSEDQTYTYVTAIIRPRTHNVTVITLQGEVVHKGRFPISSDLH